MAKDIITVRTRIIGPCARTLKLPLIVKARVCLFLICLREQVFLCALRLFSRGGSPKHPAHGPIIRALAVPGVMLYSVRYRFLVVCRTTAITR